MRWLDPSPVQVPASFEALGLHPLAAQVLVRRGITDLSAARAFLNPDPAARVPFPGIEPAVGLIKGAIGKGEEICVWGDFDVDGQTSTALLVQALQALGAKVSYYIPVRGKESHGLHIPTLQPIIERGTRLLITCDTGITAHAAVDHARSYGLQVVITDHHDLGDTLPDADAILNPKLLPEDHPLANLAGVGVAYKLAEALLQEDHPGELARLLDLVALGLVADVALLRGETRSLAQAGIQALRGTGRLGLKVMAEFARTQLETLTEDTIGFTFGPRLNALGRLGDANPAVELLLSQDAERVRVIAAQIEGLNAQRRLLTSQVYQAAESQLQQDPHLLDAPVIILSSPSWPGGVVGIVASRLVERYNKPAILLCESEDGFLRGSARSVEGLHITEAIASQSALLQGFGGHPMAAGLSLQKDALARFRGGLARQVERRLGSAAAEPPSLQIDAWLPLEGATMELASALESLAPFGAGNPALTFGTAGVTLRSASPVDRNAEHLRLAIADDAGNVQHVMWWSAVPEELPPAGSRVDIAYSMRPSAYRGQPQLSMQFVGLRLAEAEGPIIEIHKPQIEIVDLRSLTAPQEKLRELGQNCPEIEIWAEGLQRSLGTRRDGLQPAAELVIYTSPPSASELRRALELVRPQKVYLFSAPAGFEDVQEFLDQLAGLCQYALHQRGGQASLDQLAGATGGRLSAVQHGLGWLSAAGHFTFEGDDPIVISAGTGVPEPDLKRSFYLTTRSILAETAAYRKYYASAVNLPALLGTASL
jgi:single-stranded-DNA-specific exonuclease